MTHPTPTPSTSRLGTALAALGLCALLAACGLIPDQPVSDPLGLDGRTVSVAVSGDPSLVGQALAPQAVGSATVTAGFGDVQSPIAPARYELDQPMAAGATVTVASGPAPASIALSDLRLDVTVSDAQGSTTFALTPSADATLTRLSGGSYSVTETSFAVTLSGAQMSALNPILTGGGPNTVSATLTLTATSTPDLPAGSTIALSFGSGSGTIGF